MIDKKQIRKRERTRNKKEKEKHITAKKRKFKEKEPVPRISIMEREIENGETQYKIIQKKKFNCKFISMKIFGGVLTVFV